MKRTEKGKENERYDESNTFFWNTRQRKAKNKNKKRDHLHKCFVYSVANRDFDSLSITVLNESGHRSWTHSRRTHTPACKQNQEETNGIFTPSPKMKISVPHFFYSSLSQNSKTWRSRWYWCRKSRIPVSAGNFNGIET